MKFGDGTLIGIELLEYWSTFATEDTDVAKELESLKAANDMAAVEDRFYRELEFGTGGLRGVIGAGSNRMNIYTVRKATQGLAQYILKNGIIPKVAIAYDSRIKSLLFAQETARVLAANDIKAYLYPRLMPTPALSFAVRHMKCGAGVCVTASHNPSKYNGYKVYGSDGCQITTEAAGLIQNEIQLVDPFQGVYLMAFEEGIKQGGIQYIKEEVVDSFIQANLGQRLCDDACTDLKVAYTPLNGTGLECVRRVLSEMGVNQLYIVPEQERPDGNFPTCPYPNPEIPETMELGLALAKKQKADLLLATDPDCDRLGVAVRQGDEYVLLTGNEIGILLLEYICRQRIENKKMPAFPVAVKTIVTTDMAKPLAKKYNIELREVLTGFKFIGEQISALEKEGRETDYLFGFEESNGYLSGAHVRDKDGVNAVMLVCEAALFYRKENKTLVDALEELYAEHGYYSASLLSFSFEGADGMHKMQEIMDSFRENGLPAETVIEFYDYKNKIGKSTDLKGKEGLPVSNVLEFLLEGGRKLIVRPSGTEPKIKLYLSAVGKNKQDGGQKIQNLTNLVSKIISKAN